MYDDGNELFLKNGRLMEVGKAFLAQLSLRIIWTYAES